MCGICGFVSPELASRPERAITSMLASLRARGPDDSGWERSGSAVLGNTRLSIIDIDGGHQPVLNEDGSVTAVFNGEIYNYQQLRSQLLEKGHRFRSLSDSEVIVHAYEEWSADFVQRLNGMFAIAIWDHNLRTLFLYRDRFGVKPLFHSTTDQGIFFGSEIKAIGAAAGASLKLDRQALGDFLVFEYVPAPRTIFQHVEKLLPGHLLRFHEGRKSTQEYWTPPGIGNPPIKCSFEEASEEIERLIRSSTRNQLLADVPVGILLSGGIDSSTIAVLANETADPPMQSFTIGFEDPSFDESEFAALAAQSAGTDHLEPVFVGPKEAATAFTSVIDYLDEPLGDASVVPTYILCGLASRHVKVVLCGDGGDELFAGYPTYLAHRAARVYEHVPRLVRDRGIRRLTQALPISHSNFSFDFMARSFVDGFHLDPVTRHFSWMGSFGAQEAARLLVPEIGFNPNGVFDRFRSETGTHDHAQLAQRLDLRTYLPDDLLVKTDRASMAHSLEVRPPLLDHELAEFALRLPLHFLLRRNETKVLLRNVAERLLPPSLAKRPKKGFGLPMGEWLTDDRGAPFLEFLSGKNIERIGILKPRPVAKLVDEHQSRRFNHRKKLWTLIALQAWGLKHNTN